jgi:hypothetical protein
MKDMMGIELALGMHLLHFRSGPGGMIHEDAKVICIRDHSIRVKFLGTHRSQNWGKKAGDESNLFNTTGKVFVVNKKIELERIAFQNQINDLTEENAILKAEVETIHYRSDILDL